MKSPVYVHEIKLWANKPSSETFLISAITQKYIFFEFIFDFIANEMKIIIIPCCNHVQYQCLPSADGWSDHIPHVQRTHVCPEEETEYLDFYFSLIEPVATEHQRHLLVSEVILRVQSKFTKLWITENISYWYLTWLYRFLWIFINYICVDGITPKPVHSGYYTSSYARISLSFWAC